MKFVATLLAIFLVINLNAQKTALLSIDCKKPIIYTDSVTVQQISSGYFAVTVGNFDTLYANLKFIKEMLEERKRSKMESFELRAGNTTIFVIREPMAYGDHFHVNVITKLQELSSVLSLTGVKKSNKQNSEGVEKLMAYIKANKSLFTLPYEITPKIYNIVVRAD